VVNIGAFHESLNMAALWKLPVVFVIENNRYGMGTAIERSAAIRDLSRRGASYEGMEHAAVDGMDVHDVREQGRIAIERARRDGLPTLLEVRTYRYVGHSMSDPASGTYRTKAELDMYAGRDPLFLLKQRMLDSGGFSDDDWSALDAEVKRVVQDAWDFAEQSPEPQREALYEDVYVDTTSNAPSPASS
jgi:pyruvate dehydrogenase E1 component alpha subunit